MERSESTGKLSAMAKAKSAFQTFSQRAEKLLNEVKAELRGQEGSSSVQTTANGSKSPSSLPWSAKNVHEKKHEAEFKRRILEISQKSDEFFRGLCDENLLIDMRAAMASAGAILEVDEGLRSLRYKLVPKTMTDQEFWKRYTIAVKRIKQEVLDAAASDDSANEGSLITDSVIISRQESGLEALRASENLQETPVFIPLPIPPSNTVRRLSRAVQFSRACASMTELSTYNGSDRSEQSGDGSDSWSSLVSGLQGLAAKSKPKARPSNTVGTAEYHALLWTLFEADATAEDLAASSEAGVLDRLHTFAEDIQGAPVDSFVAQLAEVMAGIKTEQKMAALWLEVVKKLRKHWAERRPIPRTPVDAQPELYFCNLQQQLELLNCCISRWKRRVAAVVAAKAAATAAEAEAAALTSVVTSPASPSTLRTETMPAFREDKETVRESDPTTSTSESSVESDVRESGERGNETTANSNEASAATGQEPGMAGTTNGTAGGTTDGTVNGTTDGTTNGLPSGIASGTDIRTTDGATNGSASGNTGPDNGKRSLREGVECAVPGVRLMATGEPMYAPVTQEGPILTEDLIRETEELVLKTGSVGHGCKQLLSDMQAFKAANPGCILEDFVRWYSPPDFIQSATPTPQKSRPCTSGGVETPQKSHPPEDGVRREETPATPSASADCPSPEPRPPPFSSPSARLGSRRFFQKGSLSARMQSEGNLWQELWTSALPIPAVRQAPLFDEELAGETALDELANIAPAAFFEQLFVVALGVGFAVAQSSPQATREPLKSCLRQCADYAVETCGRGMSPTKLERLCQVYETMEHAALLPPEDDQTGTADTSEGRSKERGSTGNGEPQEEKATGEVAVELLREEDPTTTGTKPTANGSQKGSAGTKASGQKSEEDWTIL